MTDDDLRNVHARVMAVEALTRAVVSLMPNRAAVKRVFDQQAEAMISHQLALPIPDASREHFERHCAEIRGYL